MINILAAVLCGAMAVVNARRYRASRSIVDLQWAVLQSALAVANLALFAIPGVD